MASVRDKSMTTVEQAKTDYPWLFRSVHRALRRRHDGGTEIAKAINQDPTLFLNRFNPADYDHGPSLWLFLALIDYTKSREIVAAVAQLAGCVAVPDPAHTPGASESQLMLSVFEDLAVAQSMVEAATASPGSTTREDARRALLRLVWSAHRLASRLAQ